MKHFLWKAVFRYTVAEHTAHFRHCVENGNVMALSPKLVSRRKPRRPAAYNGYGAARRLSHRRHIRRTACKILVAYEAFYKSY